MAERNGRRLPLAGSPARPQGLLSARCHPDEPRIAMYRSLLLVLGVAALLAAAPLGAQSSARDLPAPPTGAAPAVLNPGDAVRITVWQKPELSGEFHVSADSTIADPFYMDIKVAGVPMDAVTTRVRAYLERYETSPRVLVEPLFRVSVAGEVRQQKLYSLRPETTVAQAVMEAGGPTERARTDRVQVLRDGTAFTVNLERPHDQLAQSAIRSGDVIMVGRQTSIIRDYVTPFSSITSALISIAYIATRYF
jgi:protein involved in polysaccharide export with SLBB domain